MNWLWLNFNDLSVQQLYALLKLRQDVFILEQQCFYPDLDELDQHCMHLLAVDGDAPESRMAAYLRVIPASHHVSGHTTLGRIVTASDYRGRSLGKQMMQETMQYLQQHHQGEIIHMSAQAYLEKFYEGFGFKVVGEPYDEDGIPHIAMETRIA